MDSKDPAGTNEEIGEEIVMNAKENGHSSPDTDKDEEFANLKEKILSLESENSELKVRIEELSLKLKVISEMSDEWKTKEATMSSRGDELLEELNRSKLSVTDLENEVRVLKIVSSRAAELETDVSRLQHDLISTMNERDEISSDLSERQSALNAIQNALKDKDLAITTLEQERDHLKKMEEEKDTTEKKLKSVDLVCRAQEEKIKALETSLNANKAEKEIAKSEAREKNVKMNQLLVQLEEMRSRLGKFEEERNEIEDLLQEKDLRIKEKEEDNENMRKKLDHEAAGFRSKETEIKALEKTVAECNTKMEVLEVERQVLVERNERADCRQPVRNIPRSKDSGHYSKMLAAAASTGVVAAGACMFYLKYIKQR